MADAALPQTDRDLASIAEARALARRAKQAAASSPSSPGTDRRDRRRHGRGCHARRPRPLPTLAVEETGYGVVADKIQKNLFASEKVYEFIRPMKTVGVVARHERRRVDRDRRAVRRRRGRRAVDQSHLDRHLQDPDRAQGALRDRAQPAPVGRPLHHARRRGDGGSRAPRRRPGRRRSLDDDGDARGHAGADEAPRCRGDSGDGRHGAGPRRLQRRQAGLRRRPGQRAGVHRADGERPEGRARHHHRQDVRQRRALLVGELGRGRRGDRRGGQARVPGAGRLLHVDGRDRRRGQGARHAAAAAQSGAGRQGGDR